MDLPMQALHATRARLAKEKSRGLLEKPGAYYARVLLKLLEDQQVFVPTAGEDVPRKCAISFGKVWDLSRERQKGRKP